MSSTEVLRTGDAQLSDLRDGLLAGTGIAAADGRAIVLNPSHTAANDNTSVGEANEPFATLTAAYAYARDGKHDTIFYVAGSTSITLSAQLVWAKSYTHLVGICAPSRVAQRSRIFQAATATGLSPLIDITGSGCMFENIYVFQGVDDNTSVLDVRVAGERNCFTNFHFAGGGHATQAIDGGASLVVTGSENRFIGCTAGVDTIPAATGMVGILFDSQASRNTFEGCDVTMYAGHTGAAFVEVADGTGIDRYTPFRHGCLFINSNSDNFLMASGFLIPAFAANNSSRILVDPTCMIHGTTKLDAGDRGVLYGGLDAYTGVDLSGVAVELKTT